MGTAVILCIEDDLKLLETIIFLGCPRTYGYDVATTGPLLIFFLKGLLKLFQVILKWSMPDRAKLKNVKDILVFPSNNW